MIDYSVLTFNIGGYEVVHEIEEKSDRAEYIYVTDDRTITSSTWNVVYVDNPNKEDNFELCWDVRYNPFKYVNTDVVIKIDGSMGITGNLDYLVDFFNDGNYDIALEMHPSRQTMYDEYLAWINQRNYPIEQANKCLSFMDANGYDVKNDKGLYQYNFMMQRKNDANLQLNATTLNVLKELAPEGKSYDRLDQTLGSFIINKYFNYMKVLPVSQDIALSGRYFSWYAHNSDRKLSKGDYFYCTPYLFGKPINTIYLKEYD